MLIFFTRLHLQSEKVKKKNHPEEEGTGPPEPDELILLYRKATLAKSCKSESTNLPPSLFAV